MTARKQRALTHAERKAIILDVLLDQFNFEMCNSAFQTIPAARAVEAIDAAWRSRAAAINDHVNGGGDGSK